MEKTACLPVREQDSEETPPRTWRRLQSPIESKNPMRNTSTDVEKTHLRESNTLVLRKHLHGRGEDDPSVVKFDPGAETPPRTWRRHYINLRKQPCLRNTSTDVEKTHRPYLGKRSLWKHLHGRGEDPRLLLPVKLYSETPPRTWRRLRLFR